MKIRQRGFTLVEMMVTVAIMGVMFTVVPPILTNITRFSRLSRARLETQRNARGALNLINQSLRQASAASVYVSQESGQPAYSSIRFTTSDSRSLKFYQRGKTL